MWTGYSGALGRQLAFQLLEHHMEGGKIQKWSFGGILLVSLFHWSSYFEVTKSFYLVHKKFRLREDTFLCKCQREFIVKISPIDRKNLRIKLESQLVWAKDSTRCANPMLAKLPNLTYLSIKVLIFTFSSLCFFIKTSLLLYKGIGRKGYENHWKLHNSPQDYYWCHHCLNITLQFFFYSEIKKGV